MLFDHPDMRRLSACARVVLLEAASSFESQIPYRKLPPKVALHVDERLTWMAAEGDASTLFDHALVAANPAPERVTNHYKWRATRPVRLQLRIPRFALECSLAWAAMPERDLTRVDISDIVRMLRVYGSSESLIEYVGENGLDSLRSLTEKTLVRIA